MLFSTKQKQNVLKSQNKDLDLKIRVNELEVIKKIKYLGLQVDCSMDWKEQITAVSSKVSRPVAVLKHAKSFLRKESLQTLYKGVMEPHFRYCCSVWGCTSLTEINPLQKLQNRAARIITNSGFNAPGRPLIKRMGLKIIDELNTCESKNNGLKVPKSTGPTIPLWPFHTKFAVLHTAFVIRGPTLAYQLEGHQMARDAFHGLSAESKQAASLHSFKKTI